MKWITEVLEEEARQKQINYINNFKMPESNTPPEDLKQLLHEVNQLLGGFSGDETWSEWDEEVKQRVFNYYLFLDNGTLPQP